MKLASPIALAVALLCLGHTAAHAADPLKPSGRWSANARGTAPVPPMGWNSWNAFFTDLDEEKVMASANILVNSGLAAKGYRYVNLDDGWWLKRDASTRRMVIKSSSFPSAKTAGEPSFKPFTDKIHAMGLKAGIYSDIGYHSCNQTFGTDPSKLPQGTMAEREIGLNGHVDQDIGMFFGDWGFDYIKVDACGLVGYAADSDKVTKEGYHVLPPEMDRAAPNRTPVAKVRARYQAVSDALQKYRPANDYVYSLCLWGDADVRKWGKEVGNMYRTSDDLTPKWTRMLHTFDSASKRALYAHPGSWNDPDMLVVGHGDFDKDHLTEARTHFALWSIMNAPLILGFDLRTADKAMMEVIGNANLIALNQDPAGHQGVIAFDSNDAQIILKTLSDPSKKGLVIFNRGFGDTKVKLLAAHLKLDATKPVTLKNLWTGETTSFTGSTEFTLKPHEHLAFEVRGTHVLGNGVFLSEIPGRINVAEDGVRIPEPDPVIHRMINPWEGSITGGQRATYTGWGGAQADTTPYEKTLQLDGKKFWYGLGVLANSRLEVKTDGEATFEATVGVDDTSNNMKDGAAFQVYGDGRLLASTPAMKYGEKPRALKADVRGVKIVELVVRQSSTHSDLPLVTTWANAALRKAVQ